MKNSLSALALTGALGALDGCTAATHTGAHPVVQCLNQASSASHGGVTAQTLAQPLCSNRNAEDYLRAQIAALRPTTPRAMRYDTRRILMIALAEHEGVEEDVLQAQIRQHHPCTEGEANVGIVRTQIYGESLVLGRFYASSYAEQVVFTDINRGVFSIVPDMMPTISGNIYTCLPNQSNYYYRYQCSHFPRDRFPLSPLAHWTLELNDRPGVAICFSPSINEPTICGFQAMSEYAHTHGASPETGISMNAYGPLGTLPARILIN